MTTDPVAARTPSVVSWLPANATVQGLLALLSGAS
jgi:hypothetical protein